MTDPVLDRPVNPVYEPRATVADASTQAEIDRAVANADPAEGLGLLRTHPELAPQIADAALRDGNFTLAHAAQTTRPNGGSGDPAVPGSATGAAIGLGHNGSGLPLASAPTTPTGPNIVNRLPLGPDGIRVPVTGNEVVIPNSTSHARTDFARQISQTPGHPLNFLLNPNTGQLWSKADIPTLTGAQPLHGERYTDMGRGYKNIWLAEHPYLVQMAHSESSFALAARTDSQILLDTANNNQSQGTYHEKKGVIVTHNSATVIDGVPASHAAVNEWKNAPISPEIANQLRGNVRPDGTSYNAGEPLLREADLAGRNVTSIKLGSTPQETAALNRAAGPASIGAPSTGTGAPGPAGTPNRIVAAVDNAVQTYDNAVRPFGDAANRVLSPVLTPVEKASQATMGTVRQAAQPAVDAVRSAAQPAVDAVKKTAAPVLDAVQPVVDRAKPALNVLGKAASRAALPVAAALDAYNIATAADKPKAITTVAGGWAGAAAGAAAGSALGPVGTLVGGAVGYVVGSGLAEKAYDGVKSLWNSVFG